ncbi:hypothetical protein BN871_DS_00270 [Paenibacillus sp. P22]|nr:hypothetical protein BN871_DS_00270 [Paenibacillus sp. P22]
MHQHGDRHRSYAARHGSDRPGRRKASLVIDIASKLAVVEPVDADVDDDGSRLDAAGPDRLGLADGHDENIRGGRDRLQILRSGMADGHGRILAEQQHGDRLADDIAASDYDGMLACDLMAAALDQLDDACRRAGQQAFVADDEIARALRAEAVHILLDADRVDDRFLRYMRRKRQLDQNAMDQLVPVELADQLQKLFLGRLPRQAMDLGVEAHFRASLFLAAHIHGRSRIVSDENYRQSRHDAGSPQLLRLQLHFRTNFSRYALSVNDFCTHAPISPLGCLARQAVMPRRPDRSQASLLGLQLVQLRNQPSQHAVDELAGLVRPEMLGQLDRFVDRRLGRNVRPENELVAGKPEHLKIDAGKPLHLPAGQILLKHAVDGRLALDDALDELLRKTAGLAFLHLVRADFVFLACLFKKHDDGFLRRHFVHFHLVQPLYRYLTR